MGQCRFCCARAVTWWWLGEYDLDRWLCGHHSNEHSETLLTQGWALMEDQRVERLHPPLPAVSSDPATH